MVERYADSRARSAGQRVRLECKEVTVRLDVEIDEPLLWLRLGATAREDQQKHDGYEW
jgi:hypothetical protein